MSGNVNASKSKVIRFLELFLSLMESGLSVPAVLKALCQEKSTRELALSINSKLEKSERLSLALCSISGSLNNYEGLLSTAEETGDIIPSLKNVVEELKNGRDELKNIITVSVYPLTVCILAFTLSTLLAVYGLPFINRIAEVDERQLTTAISRANIMLAAACAVCFIVVISAGKKNHFQQLFFQNLYYMSLNSIGVEETLEMLFASGHLKKRELAVVIRVLDGIRSGLSLKDACVSCGKFDGFTAAWLGAAGESGRVTESFEKIFRHYENKRRQVNQIVQRFIEPGAMAVSGMYIIALVTGCVIPVFKSFGTNIF